MSTGKNDAVRTRTTAIIIIEKSPVKKLLKYIRRMKYFIVIPYRVVKRSDNEIRP